LTANTSMYFWVDTGATSKAIGSVSAEYIMR
jgi:hypothetical protein